MLTSEELIKLFEQVIPAERLSTDPETLLQYSRDMTECPEGNADIVAFIQNDRELLEVVKLASLHNVGLIPRIAGTNLGGLTLPTEGGLVLDLTGMNRILEINPIDMLAVIEPGVTFQQLVDELHSQNLPLTLGIPLSPPNSSVVANCLLDGLGNLSLLHGTMGEWIAGLEVILASSEVIRTGAWAVSDIPFSRAPLPDLTGLFISWQGSTGLISKMAIQLKPDPPFRKRLFVLTYDRSTTFQLMRRLPRLKILDDMGGLSWPTGRLLYGVHDPKEKDPNEPEFFTYLDFSAYSQKELDLKFEMIGNELHQLKSQGADIEEPFNLETLCIVAPQLVKFASFPTYLDFLIDNPGGGLSWMGTYGPMSRFDKAADQGIEIMAQYNFPPVIVSRPMKCAHFGVLRFIETFNRDDPDDVKRVSECNHSLLEMVLEQGFIPYKTPIWAVNEMIPKMWPGTYGLMKRVHSLLDPLGIMNPGRWGF